MPITTAEFSMEAKAATEQALIELGKQQEADAKDAKIRKVKLAILRQRCEIAMTMNPDVTKYQFAQADSNEQGSIVTQALNNLGALQEAYTHHKNRVANLKEKNKDLEEAVQTERTECIKYINDLEDAETEIKDLKGTIAKANNEIALLKSDRDHFRQRSAKLQTRATRYQWVLIILVCVLAWSLVQSY